MKKANVKKVTALMEDYLQYQYLKYLNAKVNGMEDEASHQFTYYLGACSMVEAIGGEWRRFYNGNNNDQKELDSIENYSHTVFFPEDSRIEGIPIDRWKF